MIPLNKKIKLRFTSTNELVIINNTAGIFATSSCQVYFLFLNI